MADMKTIYVVTSGEYSDYSISAVYDSQELAEAMVGDRKNYTIEEFPLNPGEEHYHVGRTLRRVSMRKSGDVLKVEDVGIGWADAEVPADSVHLQYEQWTPGQPARIGPTRIIFLVFWTYVWSENDERAIKVANERRVRWVAEGKWDVEKSRLKDAYEKSSYSTKYYRWDLETGE